MPASCDSSSSVKRPLALALRRRSASRLRHFSGVRALHAILHSTEGAQIFHQLVACELRLVLGGEAPPCSRLAEPFCEVLLVFVEDNEFRFLLGAHAEPGSREMKSASKSSPCSAAFSGVVAFDFFRHSPEGAQVMHQLVASLHQLVEHSRQLSLVLGGEAPACSRLLESVCEAPLRCFFKVAALQYSPEGAEV